MSYIIDTPWGDVPITKNDKKWDLKKAHDCLRKVYCMESLDVHVVNGRNWVVVLLSDNYYGNPYYGNPFYLIRSISDVDNNRFDEKIFDHGSGWK